MTSPEKINPVELACWVESFFLWVTADLLVFCIVKRHSFKTLLVRFSTRHRYDRFQSENPSLVEIGSPMTA